MSAEGDASKKFEDNIGENAMNPTTSSEKIQSKLGSASATSTNSDSEISNSDYGKILERKPDDLLEFHASKDQAKEESQNGDATEDVENTDDTCDTKVIFMNPCFQEDSGDEDSASFENDQHPQSEAQGNDEEETKPGSSHDIGVGMSLQQHAALGLIECYRLINEINAYEALRQNSAAENPEAAQSTENDENSTQHELGIINNILDHIENEDNYTLLDDELSIINETLGNIDLEDDMIVEYALQEEILDIIINPAEEIDPEDIYVTPEVTDEPEVVEYSQEDDIDLTNNLINEVIIPDSDVSNLLENNGQQGNLDGIFNLPVANEHGYIGEEAALKEVAALEEAAASEEGTDSAEVASEKGADSEGTAIEGQSSVHGQLEVSDETDCVE